MSQEIVFGPGKLRELGSIIERLGPKSIFLVTGKRSYDSCGAREIVEEACKGREVHRFSDFEVNPKIEDVKRGIKICLENGCDLVVAVGGGSVMDVGKSVAILSRQEDKEHPERYITKEEAPLPKTLPMVAAPTTFGTGSESTHFAVVYIGKDKYSLADGMMVPKVAIIDPRMSKTLTRKIKGSTAFDAICQALEAYWSNRSTEESKEYSTKALKLMVPSIERFVNEGYDERAASDMALGSNLAGRAINIAKTTAVHSTSYPMTSYFGVPHGQACAITLPEFFRFNCGVGEGNIQDSRGIGYVKDIMKSIPGLFGMESEEECYNKIKTLMVNCGLATRLGDLNINDIKLILDNGFNPERVKNNPVKVTRSDLRRLLEGIG